MATPSAERAIVVHGGAGDIDRTELGPDRDKAYREALSEAVKAGAAVLDRGYLRVLPQRDGTDGAFALHGVKDLRIGWSRAAADTTLASIDSKML